MDCCKTCVFAIKHSSEMYSCHRRSPIAVHDPAANMGIHPEAFKARWPMVTPHMGCGDYAPDLEKAETD